MNLRQVYESLACHLRINLSKDRIYLFNGETGDRLRYWKRNPRTQLEYHL
jgi:hypothetical protein